MKKAGADRSVVLDELAREGGSRSGVARRVSERTGIPEADVHGVATFYSLVARPDVDLRVCQGTSCRLAGSEALVEDARARGLRVERVSCLGQCDRAPAALGGHHEPVLQADPGAVLPANPDLPIDLGGEDDGGYASFAAARALGHDSVLDALEEAGLQGRGGAGFPAHIKWRSVREQEGPRYLVVNADEGEPGTFKDREVMLRRPHRLLEGMAIAADVIGAEVAWIYLRGEFQPCRRSIEAALVEADLDLEVRIIDGHGAYICGEETALLEAIEGRRGMPRLKPPYPTVQGLFGRPTLIHNVETLACVPSIVVRGGAWFAGLGRGEPGTKLYCVSGHVERPGVYELPLGVTLDDVVEVAGGYVGTPRAFSPGGASSGFLPMTARDVPLTFRELVKHGSMLGSAGIVVLNDTVDMAEAARWGQVFFEDESCGQCAPCRIGCSLQRQAIDRFTSDRDPSHLEHVTLIAHEMEEGSICGLGIAASAPLITALRHFPEVFGDV